MQVKQKIDLVNLLVAGFEPPGMPMDESFPQEEILISPLLLPISRYFWRNWQHLAIQVSPTSP
jgi:hypothetical protein